jgi:diadenylate cyclase
LRTSTPSALLSALDILVVAYLAYRLLLLVRGGRAWRILLGVTAYLVVWFVSGLIGLQTLHFLLDKGLLLGPVALVILFLPELRAALEGFGGLGAWTEKLAGRGGDTTERTIEAIVAAVKSLSKDFVGALIVIERQRSLDDIARTGVLLDARVSAPLLCSLFHSGNPLHDGAVLIRGDRVLAASCLLPSSDRSLSAHLHMRHRAGLGVTEETDAVCVIVSEERGTVSLAWGGRMREGLSIARLEALLKGLLISSEKDGGRRGGGRRGGRIRAQEARQG